MNKKEKTNPKEVRNQNYEAKKMNTSENFKKKKNKDLPWWVEILFVQIGLPDKLLIKILKAKKESKELIKNETTNPKEVRNQNYEAKKMNTSENLKKKKDKDLPWWVELLFVQVGLPDKLLIKILKAKKTSKEFIKNENKLIIIFLFVITTLAYFYPVIKHAKNKLDCEAIAKNYIIKNKNTIGINNREIKMLSTNFCYGGEEIYEIENLKN